MDAIKIKITADNNGIHYQGGTGCIKATRGQTIKWVCGNKVKNLAILFAPRTPLAYEQLPDGRTTFTHGLNGKNGKDAVSSISENALSGAYEYIVSVWDGEKIWIDDPEVIVDPPTRGRG